MIFKQVTLVLSLVIFVLLLKHNNTNQKWTQIYTS